MTTTRGFAIGCFFGAMLWIFLAAVAVVIG